MGLYDTVEFEPEIAKRLPGYDVELFGIPPEDIAWQTKSIQRPLMESFRVTDSGYLEREEVEVHEVPKEERTYPDAEEGSPKAMCGMLSEEHLGWERRGDYHGSFIVNHSFRDIERMEEAGAAVLDAIPEDHDFPQSVGLEYTVQFTEGRLSSIKCTGTRGAAGYHALDDLEGQRETFEWDQRGACIDVSITPDNQVTVSDGGSDVTATGESVYESLLRFVDLLAQDDPTGPSPEELTALARETFQDGADVPEASHEGDDTYDLFGDASEQFGPGGDD